MQMLNRTKSRARCTFCDPKVSAPHLSVGLIQKGIFMTVEFPKTCSSVMWCYLEIVSKVSKSIRYRTYSAFIILALILMTAELNLNFPPKSTPLMTI